MRPLESTGQRNTRRVAMQDLLGSVKTNKNALYDQRITEDDVDIEKGSPPPDDAPPTEQEQNMQTFFKSVDVIKKDLNEIKVLQREVIEAHERGKTLVKTKEVQKHQEIMQVQ